MSKLDKKPGNSAGLAALFRVFLVPSCAPPLLTPDEPRSQFDRYDAVRNQHENQDIFDPYSRRRPNLGHRLVPKD